MQRERNSPTPQIGDRVICLRNNWEVGIYNGMLGTIKSLQDELNDDGEHHWYMAEIKMDDGTLYKGKISKHQFEANSTQREVPGLLHKQVGDLFDFGYALTVHKAQGSQARKVVVFEERNKHMDDEAWRRWLYTAVTRAEEELVIIGE
jgi:exodeoxyribonuclease-5